MEARLKQIREQLDKGESPRVSVRDFLWWFYAQRRGYWVVRRIRSALATANLKTIPNFEHAWIDASISFEKTDAVDPPESCEITEDLPEELPVSGSETASAVWISREATYRVSRLAAANQTIVSVRPEEPISKIITKMMSGGYSQVPVMTSDRSVDGIVTWQSIGSRLAMGVNGSIARDFSEDHHEISSDRSIFDAIPIIVSNDYVLVRGEANLIAGIITASDLSLQFRELTEPFLLLGEIENLVRNLIGEHFQAFELREACEDRGDGRIINVDTVADLNFGEYIRLLQNPDRWDKIDISVDRASFCKGLDDVREIRNDVMHFDPDGIAESHLRILRDFTRFLQQIEDNGKV